MALREKLEQIRSNPRPTNEEAAKFQILAPILAELGWDPFGLEILWEHSVGATKGGGRVDIALKAEGSIRALIEAKAPGAQLSQHVDQVLMYAYREGVDICVLTDGLQWWLYLPREKGEPEKRRFAVLNVDRDPVEQLCDDLNNFLGRESLHSGHAERRAEQVLKALREAQKLEEKMPAIWRQMLDEPDHELIELIGQRVYDRLNLRPGRDQIIAAMSSRPIPPKRGGTPEPPVPEPPPGSTSGKPSGRRRTRRPSAIRLWDERHPVRTHADILMTVVEQLHRRHPHEFDRAVEPLRRGENQYVSRDPGRVRGTRLKQTPSGQYVDINLSAEDIKKRVVQLLAALGHRDSDLEYLYEG